MIIIVKMKFKILLVSTAVLASAYLGDHYNVKDMFVEPIRYRNVKVDSKTYPKPFQLQKKYQVNEKGKLEVYIGCDKEWHKVSEELRVNERSLGERLKYETKEVFPYFKKKVEDLAEWYKRSFGNGNPD